MSPFINLLVAAVVLAVGVLGGPLDDSITPRDEISDLACSAGPYVFTNYSGTFASPNSPGLYPDNSLCQWLITGQEPGGFVELTFVQLALESHYDFVNIYDGSTTLAPILTGFDGTWSPPPTKIRSTQPSMLIVFTSDASIVERGFQANFTSVPYFAVNDPCSSLSRPLLITDGAGEITSTYYSDYYLNYANCQWLIESQVPGGVVTLDFLTFATERFVDSVTLFDGPTASSPVIVSLNGTTVTTGWRSTQAYMLIRFTSNSWNVLSGWQASYSSQPAA